MAEAAANMESWFSFDEHLLDYLLIFWISAGLCIVGVINSLTSFFGPLQQPRVSWDKARDSGSSAEVVPQGPHGHESTFWLNSALNWVYLHYDHFPEFVGVWVKSLNDQAQKLGGPVQVKIEKVESGSLPPKFGDVTHDAGPEDIYVVNCRVDSRDLSFAVFASQQTHEGVKLTNLNVTVLKLKGHLKIKCYRNGQEMMADVSFDGRPDIKVQGKPVNPYMFKDKMGNIRETEDPSDLVDIGVAEEVVRNTICLTSTTFNLSHWVNKMPDNDAIPIHRTHSKEADNLQYGGSSVPSTPLLAAQQTPQLQQQQQQQQLQQQQLQQQQYQQQYQQQQQYEQQKQQQQQQQYQQQQYEQQQQKQQQQQQQPQVFQPQVFETIDAKEVKQQQSAFHVPTLSTPTKSQQQQQRAGLAMPVDKRLLVKVIKASGLKQNEGAVDPYCVIYVDNPPQSELSSVVRNTYNPFWDEQFYFDLTPMSSELRFEVLDQRKPPNDNFLGEAIVYCEDLMRNPSSRQIIPLQGRLGVGEFVSGSITVEMLCMDPSDDMNVSMSPRRTVETSKSVSPGGTLVTTTTTTTQKPQNYSTNVDGSPSYIEKKSIDYSSPDSETESLPYTTESSPTDEVVTHSSASNVSSAQSPEITYTQPETKERKSFASRIKKRFSRSKKRSQSADRATSSLREGSNYLRPPGPHSKACSIDSDQSFTTFNSSTNSRDDIDLHRTKEDETPNLKKSRSLGGSLKKLFRRSRKRSRSLGRGEASRESSVSRQSRHTSQGPSRESSLTRNPSHNPNQHDTVIL